MKVFDLTVPVLLLGVRVQGVRGKMPRRQVPVCALLQEQGLLLAILLVNDFGLAVAVLLLGVRVQGMWSKILRRHMRVCALLQKQGLLASACSSVWSNGFCLTSRCQSLRGTG